MNRIMPCPGAHPPVGEEVVEMSRRLHDDDVEVDVVVERLSTAPARRKERMS
jgi:hypothetical protein